MIYDLYMANNSLTTAKVSVRIPCDVAALGDCKISGSPKWQFCKISGTILAAGVIGKFRGAY